MFALLSLFFLTAVSEARNCSKGKACGDSCIARDKTCRTNSTAGSRATPAVVTPAVAAPTPAAVAPTSKRSPGPVVMWAILPDGRLKLAQGTGATYDYISCTPAIGGCDVPPLGISLTLTMADAPAKFATLSYSVAGVARRCIVLSCTQ